MADHLSTDQISKVLSGQATPEEEQHVQRCNQCAESMTRVASTLALFRESVHQWALHDDRSIAVDTTFLRTRAASLRPRFHFAIAAAAIVAAVIIPFPSAMTMRPPEVSAPEDSMLRDQVNTDMSRPVA